MKNIIKRIKNYASYCLLINCLLFIQNCNLTTEEINERLNKIEEEKIRLEKEEIELERIKEERQDMDKKFGNFQIMQMVDKFKFYNGIGQTLYLALKKDYEDISKMILTGFNFNYYHFEPLIAGRALYEAARKGTDELNSIYEKLLDLGNEKSKLISYVAMSWLEAIKKEDKGILLTLVEAFENKFPPVEIIEILTGMRKKLIRYEYITEEKYDNLKSWAKERVNKQLLFSAIPLPTARPTYEFSACEGEAYSDSEEEDAPHFNGVYNLTKRGVFNIEAQRECYSPMLGPEERLVNNYAADSEKISLRQLKNDACSILVCAGLQSKNSITILCVALRRNDGRIKKFVFTNEPSVYQWDNTEENLKKIAGQAHVRGYHVIMAQQAHAEGELIQFLRERPTRYTHIIGLGCSRDGHCKLCTEMLEKLLGQGTLDKLSISNNGIGRFDNWYIPLALDAVFYKNRCKPDIPDSVKIISNWGDQRLHRQLTREEWEAWKRTKIRESKGKEKVKRKAAGKEELDKEIERRGTKRKQEDIQQKIRQSEQENDKYREKEKKVNRTFDINEPKEEAKGGPGKEARARKGFKKEQQMNQDEKSKDK